MALKLHVQLMGKLTLPDVYKPKQQSKKHAYKAIA